MPKTIRTYTTIRTVGDYRDERALADAADADRAATEYRAYLTANLATAIRKGWMEMADRYAARLAAL